MPDKDILSVVIPDVIVSIDKTGDAVVVVEKVSQKLMLYVYNGTYEKLLEFDCSTGESSGIKLRAGDKKTPEGIYFFLHDYIDKYLAPIYGSRAFTTDYPNFIDRTTGKDGSAIWLHGTNKVLKPRDSNGCVALTNKDIDTLVDYIKLNRTAVAMVEKINYVPVESVDAEKVSIKNFLSKWNNTLEDGTYQDYLKLYDTQYVPEIRWWSQWNLIREKIKKNSGELEVNIQDISIFKHNNIYVVLFDQVLKSIGNNVSFAGTRKLFISKIDEKLKIIGDEYQPKENLKDTKLLKHPLLIASLNLEKLVEIQKKKDLYKNIENMVMEWVKAWSSNDMDKYASYYALDFYSNGMNKKRWVNYKRRLANKYNYINVAIKNIKIRIGKNGADVSFFQIYQSSGYSAKGIKKLKLIHEDGKWKIMRETWKKS
ncbi:MAG: hypothetical protein B6I31_01945 [Desulfobacteraceae bacterium 4572_19]|nr:MAG: hypothetical protein B6I31_01945 [Desulfobacteraceae bacterium 4572_19]